MARDSGALRLFLQKQKIATLEESQQPTWYSLRF